VLSWLRSHPALQKPREQERRARLSTGLVALDALLGGGLPCGGVTEIIGAGSSGRTAMSLAILAAATRRGETVAWLDSGNALDPWSVQGAGVCLDRLLWVRPSEQKAINQTLKAADLVLDAGGFAVLVMDLANARDQAATRPAWWVRLTRRLECTPTVLISLAPREVAGSAAMLRLGCRRRGPGMFVRVLRWREDIPGGCVRIELGQPRD